MTAFSQDNPSPEALYILKYASASCQFESSGCLVICMDKYVFDCRRLVALLTPGGLADACFTCPFYGPSAISVQ